MDAPIYSPAAAFEQPKPVPTPLTVSSVSLAELMSAPAAWAVVLKHAPVFKVIVTSKQIQPFITNMMIESFIIYGGIVTPAQIAAINADLASLPSSEGPKT
ncbi:hypothetical protein [Sphingomonas sp. PP-CC-3A-396]|uniref:hypothetical protein n=1 Tax=Sphingomonas sp. PP-CC-3A-396 TaxID=2135655 RepID=UPI0010509660|nr:hypothetical protein [Sphingomonas sp. PP-CC-3A-396]TCQ06338.1 hypothetical protein C8J40_105126 [Sphingomonas sp. PP-CC-3A-396]